MYWVIAIADGDQFKLCTSYATTKNTNLKSFETFPKIFENRTLLLYFLIVDCLFNFGSANCYLVFFLIKIFCSLTSLTKNVLPFLLSMAFNVFFGQNFSFFLIFLLHNAINSSNSSFKFHPKVFAICFFWRITLNLASKVLISSANFCLSIAGLPT